MKDVFFKQLRSELEVLSLDESKIISIIEDYDKMFELGSDAGLSDAEIIGKLGNPKSIASEYSGYKKVKYEDHFYDDDPRKIVLTPIQEFDIDINLTFCKLYINYHDSETIVVIPDEFIDETFQASLKGNTFSLFNTKKSVFFSKGKRNAVLKVFLPKNISIKKLMLNDISSYIQLDEIACDRINFKTINGSVDCTKMIAGDIKINSVNGKININNISCEEVELESVNAKFEVNTIESQRASIRNVTGLIKIANIDESKLTSKNVVGTIRLNY